MPRIIGSTGGHDTHDGAAIRRLASHRNGQPEHGRSRGRREDASARGRQAAERDSRPGGGSGVDRLSAGTPGLVICPKSVRDDAESGDGTDWSAADALRLRFPSPEMVASAAALFEPTAPWALGRDRLGIEPESGRFRITVGPGVVRLSWANPVRAERSAEREVDRHRFDVAVEDGAKSGRDEPDPRRRPMCARRQGHWQGLDRWRCRVVFGGESHSDHVVLRRYGSGWVSRFGRDRDHLVNSAGPCPGSPLSACAGAGAATDAASSSVAVVIFMRGT